MGVTFLLYERRSKVYEPITAKEGTTPLVVSKNVFVDRDTGSMPGPGTASIKDGSLIIGISMSRAKFPTNANPSPHARVNGPHSTFLFGK